MEEENLVGSYLLCRNENMNKYLSKSDVPFIVRKVIMSSTPTMVISKEEDGTWQICIKMMTSTKVMRFKHGEDFAEKAPSGRGEIMCTGFVESSGLKITSKSEHGEEERRFFLDDNGGQLVLHLKNLTKDVEAKRFFKRIK